MMCATVWNGCKVAATSITRVYHHTIVTVTRVDNSTSRCSLSGRQFDIITDWTSTITHRPHAAVALLTHLAVRRGRRGWRRDRAWLGDVIIKAAQDQSTNTAWHSRQRVLAQVNVGDDHRHDQRDRDHYHRQPEQDAFGTTNTQ